MIFYNSIPTILLYYIYVHTYLYIYIHTKHNFGNIPLTSNKIPLECQKIHESMRATSVFSLTGTMVRIEELSHNSSRFEDYLSQCTRSDGVLSNRVPLCSIHTHILCKLYNQFMSQYSPILTLSPSVN